MKFVLIVILAIVAYSQAAESESLKLIYPYCRCCDWFYEQQALDNFAGFVKSYGSCSPVISCLRRCLYRYNPNSAYFDEFYDCSINTDVMLESYKWLMYNYQCLPYSVLECAKRCTTSFERYPSCYWTLNADIGEVTYSNAV